MGLKGVEWIDLAQDREKWCALVRVSMNLRGPVKCGVFVVYLRKREPLKKDSAIGVRSLWS
jgi:hypothetical protein